MGVWVAMVALATWCVDRHVHRHSMPLAALPCEAQRKLAPRPGRQLGGQRAFIFAGDGPVLAPLCLLGGIPVHGPALTSEHLRLRKECDSTFRSRWSPYPQTQTKNT